MSKSHPPRSRPFSVAVVGNPNSGKTTLFNALTGANARIGNFPGITVERRTGTLNLPHSGKVELVDVPGTYSLTARSLDEEVAINALLGRKGLDRPDAALIVLDATALERSLYFLIQVLEFDIPVIAVLNMQDVAHEEGIEIDLDALRRTLKVPVVSTVARKRQGVADVKTELDDLLSHIDKYRGPGWFWEPSADLAADLAIFEPIIQEEVRFQLPTLDSRRAFGLWLLASLDENSELVVRPRLRQLTLAKQADLKASGRDLDKESIARRYEFIDSLAPRLIKRPREERDNLTDRIDAILTHPFWGSLIFLVIMALIFQALFSWSEPAMIFIEENFGKLSAAIVQVAPAGFLRDLVTDGIIDGVGGVVVFLPQILFLFFFISLLEGSGYLARAAFLVDRLMSKLGLPGVAFVPMLSGFACAIPAIMATRTIDNRRDRMLTIMVIPLMSCSARLPVFTLIIAMLFPAQQKVGFLSVGTLMMLGLYLLSTILAITAVAVLGRTVLKGRPQPMLLELPAYRVPDLKTVLLILWERTRVFLTTAGTIILMITIVLWLLLSFPTDEQLSHDYAVLQTQSSDDPELIAQLQADEKAEQLQNSYAGRLGSLLEPAIEPLGFDWKIGIGLIGSFAAREVFVSTMGVVYGIGEEATEESVGLREAMRRDQRSDGSPLWTPLVGASLLIFFLIAMQCMSTLAVTKRETRSWKWTFFMLVYLTGAAYFASLLVYQGGQLLGLA